MKSLIAERKNLANFAQFQNDVPAKNGFSIRVDHLSLLAKIFDRVPEKFIGISSSQTDSLQAYEDIVAGVKKKIETSLY